MALELRPLAKHVGVEAIGVDLNRLDDAGFGRMKTALAEHGVLF